MGWCALCSSPTASRKLRNANWINPSRCYVVQARLATQAANWHACSSGGRGRLLIYIPTFLRRLWHFEPFPKEKWVKRCSGALALGWPCWSGKAWRPRGTELMSPQERKTNLQVSLDQSDSRWGGQRDTVWKSQWGRRGGPWTDPWGLSFKAFYRGVVCSSSLERMLTLYPAPTFSLSGSHNTTKSASFLILFCQACVCHKFIANCKIEAAKLQGEIVELWCNLEPEPAHLNCKGKLITSPKSECFYIF